jgi:hypothetical protein
MVINNEKITNDASVSFYVITKAFKEVPDGWYTKNVFNADAVIQSYAYLITLSGRGYGKETDVKEAIEKSFSGWKKDETQSTEEMSIFNNETKTIKSFIQGSQVVIVISSSTNEVGQDLMQGAIEEPIVTEEVYGNVWD